MPVSTKLSRSQQVALALKNIIQTVYRDGVDAVLSFKLAEDSAISGKFKDGPQVYDFTILPDDKISYVEAESNGTRSDAYLIGFYMDSGFAIQGRMDASPTTKKRQCTEGKSCGNTCIARGRKCQMELGPQAKQAMATVRQEINSTTNPPKESSEFKLSPGATAGLIAGAALLGVPAATYGALVARYRLGLDESVKKAMAEAEKYDVPDEVKGGFRVSPIAEKDGHKGITLRKDAEQVTFVVNGFGGTGGTGGDFFGGQFARNFKNHHVVGVENPEFDVPGEIEGDHESEDDIEQSKVTLELNRNRLKTMLQNVTERNENPVAIRMAARAYAYHKKTGKPINLIGYSAGGMVTTEAAELLKRMGVKDVRVANMGAPHYGLLPAPEKSMFLMSESDQAFNLPGFDPPKKVMVNSVEDHMQYLVKEELKMEYNPRIKSFVPTGQIARRSNKEVTDKLKDFFGREPEMQAAKADSDRLDSKKTGGYVRRTKVA